MDKELQQALAAILNKTSGAIESGVVFLQGQLPEVIHQLLMWKAIESGIVFAACFACSTLLARLSFKSWKSHRNSDYADPPYFIFPSIPCLFLVLIAFKNLDWLQIIIAPKIYLIEYAASLAK